jgi:hypothetical protein
MASHAYEVDSSPKIKALKERHSALEDRILEAMKSPSTASADFYLKQLKKQKLILKDTIEIMSASSANH